VLEGAMKVMRGEREAQQRTYIVNVIDDEAIVVVSIRVRVATESAIEGNCGALFGEDETDVASQRLTAREHVTDVVVH